MMKVVRGLLLVLVGCSNLVGMDVSKVLAKSVPATEQEATASVEAGISEVEQTVHEEDLERLRGLSLGVNACDCYGRPHIYAATFRGDVGAVKYLFNLGTDSMITYKGMTLLHAAACESEAVMALVLSPEYGLRGLINDKDDNGNTPLISAAKKGFSGIVKILLDAGADAKVRTVSGKDAFYYALKGRH